MLVLVAPADRQCRIEYGPGLRGRLTDAVCTRIVAHEMLPRFREGRHGDGLVAGADAVVAALRAQGPAPDVPAPARRAPWTSDEVAGLICVLGVVGVALFVAWKVRREDDRGPGGGGGTVSGPAPWLRPGGLGGRPSGRFGGFGGGRAGGGGASGRW